MSAEVRDSLVDVGFWHIGTGNEGVSTLYGFPLRRIDADFTLEQAEQVMQNATALSEHANEDTVVTVAAEILD